jgi:hypothetical protein
MRVFSPRRRPLSLQPSASWAARLALDGLRFAGMVLIGIFAVWALVLLFG